MLWLYYTYYVVNIAKTCCSSKAWGQAYKTSHITEYMSTCTLPQSKHRVVEEGTSPNTLASPNSISLLLTVLVSLSRER